MVFQYQLSCVDGDDAGGAVSNSEPQAGDGAVVPVESGGPGCEGRPASPSNEDFRAPGRNR